MASSKKLIFLTMFIIVMLPTIVVGECTCEDEDEDGGESNRREALKYKLGAIFSIFLASTFGVCIPVLGRKRAGLSPDRDLFYVIKAFAAGVILATGFIHVLPDAFENLTSPCLSENPWGKFPFTGFVAMLAAIGTLSVDAYAMSYYTNKSHPGVARDSEQSAGEVVFGHHSHDGHAHAVMHLDSGSELLRHRVISQVLELGIIVHSVIIGIALGASESPDTIKPLVAALTFHQFFEGIGLGGCITQAKFDAKAVIIMTLFFSLTTSTGIGIGIGIMNVYKENSKTALIVQGLFDSASAGILIYMALVDLLAADFMSPRLQKNRKLQLVSHISLLFGAGCMSVLAIWA